MFPFFKYCMYDVIKVPPLLSIFMQVLPVEGVINVCWSIDLYFPFFVIQASLESASALALSPLRTCCISISSKSVSIMSWT